MKNMKGEKMPDEFDAAIKEISMMKDKDEITNDIVAYFVKHNLIEKYDDDEISAFIEGVKLGLDIGRKVLKTVTDQTIDILKGVNRG